MAFGVKPDRELSSAVKSLVDEIGVQEAATLLGIGREATSRLAGGIGVRQGTLALATKRLDQHARRKKR